MLNVLHGSYYRKNENMEVGVNISKPKFDAALINQKCKIKHAAFTSNEKWLVKFKKWLNYFNTL